MQDIVHSTEHAYLESTLFFFIFCPKKAIKRSYVVNLEVLRHKDDDTNRRTVVVPVQRSHLRQSRGC